MDAVEYLRERSRMCKAIDCTSCPFFRGYAGKGCMEDEGADPQAAVEFVRMWAAEHPVEPGITLTAMERRFVRIYIDKGYLWAARDKSGELNLYRKEPKRGWDVFLNTSPTLSGCRTALSHMLPGIKWENSPVCLPKLLESAE